MVFILWKTNKHLLPYEKKCLKLNLKEKVIRLWQHNWRWQVLSFFFFLLCKPTMLHVHVCVCGYVVFTSENIRYLPFSLSLSLCLSFKFLSGYKSKLKMNVCTQWVNFEFLQHNELNKMDREKKKPITTTRT